jgi:MFS family permease
MSAWLARRNAALVGLRADMFSSLHNPNYRRYLAGQAISLIGTWMQSIAQSYFVYQLTRSATDVGYIVALQTIPVLLLGPYGGVIADRVDKRRMMMTLQSMMGVLALVLGLLTVTGVVRLWQIAVLAVLLGLNNTFENPARQTFVLEMVGAAELRNAVTLNSVLVNAARAIGPAVAGILIATVGVGICFLLNAVSFAAVVFSLATLDKTQLERSDRTHRAKGQLREGLRYVAGEPALLVPLIMMAVVGCLAYEFQVTLPVIAGTTFHGGSVTYGFMTAAMGLGAVVGGLYGAARGRTGLAALIRSSAIFGIVIALAAVAPNLVVELVALALVGAASVTFLSKGNSTLQLTATPQMRGRVMALWAVAFLGSTPIGGPFDGWVAQTFGARWGLGVGSVACLVAAAFALAMSRRASRRISVGVATVGVVAAGSGSQPGADAAADLTAAGARG